ncbi:MAG: hypothetical protein M3R51_10655 [Candidatus Eremiobacteraeota bacterium]|nr:hypothetical protein [Candidatus Eremiobacteraeota bacterium]
MKNRNLAILAAIAIGAIAAWPFFSHTQPVQAAYIAPVLPDYAHRNDTIAFYEKRTRQHPQDQVSASMLGGQYMQRYREDGDVSDIFRALHEAGVAIKLQPQNNAGAHETAGSAYTALHRFREALAQEQAAREDQPSDSNAPAQIASLDMELGRYDLARENIRAAERIAQTPTVMAIRARYYELTGHLQSARDLLAKATTLSDSVIDNSAQGRAWFHFRQGEMAFSAGDVTTAKREERTAIAQFPNFEMAYRALARFCWATKDWQCTREAADRGIAIAPLPETVGYKADAQRATGDASGARESESLIFAIERLGNAYHLSDRLLAVYYSDHRIRADDALRIAQREVTVRGDEIFAQDTLAWAAAMDGRWDVARHAIAKAVRYNTQDPRIQFHAGVIALHFRDMPQARRRLQSALALNSQFHPHYADQARSLLASIVRP